MPRSTHKEKRNGSRFRRSGNDQLNGGAANDTLNGGAGEDSCLFNSALNTLSNVDFAAGFSVLEQR